MITVKQCKELGIELIEGDKVNGRTISKAQADATNFELSNIVALDYRVDEFAWRENTGEQPYSDNVTVEIETISKQYDGKAYTSGVCDWRISDGFTDIKRYRPHLPSLEKMMNEKQEKKIEFDNIDTRVQPDQLGPKRTEQSTAVETLRRMGYEWKGGALWKPPLGEVPKYVRPTDFGSIPDEWDGEGLPPVGVEVMGTFHYDPATAEKWAIKYISKDVGCYMRLADGKEYTFATDSVCLFPIETPEQKEQREREEAAYELACVFGHNDFGDAKSFAEYHPSLCEKFLAIVDKTGYRKQ